MIQIEAWPLAPMPTNIRLRGVHGWDPITIFGTFVRNLKMRVESYTLVKLSR